MDNSGSILLHDDTGANVAASFKKSNYGELVIQGGFRQYVVQLELKEDDLVVSMFHRRAGSASITVRMLKFLEFVYCIAPVRNACSSVNVDI
jgi:hypothetical protein